MQANQRVNKASQSWLTNIIEILQVKDENISTTQFTHAGS